MRDNWFRAAIILMVAFLIYKSFTVKQDVPRETEEATKRHEAIKAYLSQDSIQGVKDRAKIDSVAQALNKAGLERKKTEIRIQDKNRTNEKLKHRIDSIGPIHRPDF